MMLQASNYSSVGFQIKLTLTYNLAYSFFSGMFAYFSLCVIVIYLDSGCWLYVFDFQDILDQAKDSRSKLFLRCFDPGLLESDIQPHHSTSSGMCTSFYLCVIFISLVCGCCLCSLYFRLLTGSEAISAFDSGLEQAMLS